MADRDAAQRLTGTRLYVERDRLPPAEEEEFYLADLIGLPGRDRGGAPLGAMRAVEDHGAGAFLVIEARRSGWCPSPAPRCRWSTSPAAAASW